ncbi:MAG: Asp-tRNA(Asn)/Glu-tRNA(Gln) amidotransferase subunit GatB [Burkholderiales bacterium]
MDWEIVIGLETHAQLSTVSKIFSGASTEFGADPNTQACGVDIALPGVLPVINRGAVERAIRFGLAVNGGGDNNVCRRSVFARKNYFYPDLPKGYQISQFELPIVAGGEVTITTAKGEKTVRLTRAHLEEDAGKSLHEDFRGMTGIDLNRAGTPLLEIVSEPDMRSADEAVAYAKALHTLVRWIGICDGNMQEGSFRCDANVSVRRPGAPLGTRREIKNLNSFRFLQQAIEYEAQWQIDTLEGGGKIRQATVLFDSVTGTTREMRSKEDAHDYRYFPDPDLLPVAIDEPWIERVRTALPELPEAMRQRFEAQYKLSAYDAGLLTANRDTAIYFEAVAEKSDAKLAANWINGEFSNRLGESNLDMGQAPLGAATLAWMINRIADGTISGKMAKDRVLPDLWSGQYHGASEVDLAAYLQTHGLAQISDSSEIEKIIDQVLAANVKSVEEFRAGREKAFNSLVGQAMKATKGKGNPATINEILRRKLEQ